MDPELFYLRRPREMRRRASERDRAARRERHERMLRASLQPHVNKLIDRGLNGDSSGGILAGVAARLAEMVGRKLHPLLRMFLHQLDVIQSPLLFRFEFERALAHIITANEHWLGRLTDWQPPDSRDRKQHLHSLLRHLFCRYPVPRPFDWAWTGASDDAFAAAGRGWLIRVGQGGNLRHAPGLPYPLTRAMAHQVLRAPQDLTLPQALRWGQLVGMGVGEHLARNAAQSQLGHTNADDAAAVVVARFFVANPHMHRRHTQEIVDYVIARRRGHPPIDPAPHFTLAGRSVEVVMREIRGWHAEINRIRTAFIESWSSCGIDGFELLIADSTGAAAEPARWFILELTTGSDLMEEGRAMHHCVATYARLAAQGQCAIFSLRRDDAFSIDPKRIATIEVDVRERSVSQVRGPCNRQVSRENADLVRRWAGGVGLKISSSAW